MTLRIIQRRKSIHYLIIQAIRRFHLIFHIDNQIIIISANYEM